MGVLIIRWRQGPTAVGFVVEESVVAAMVVAVGREHIEERTAEALLRFTCSAEATTEAHEFFVVDRSVRGAPMQHSAQRVDVTPGRRAVGAAVAIKALGGEVAAFAVVNQASPGQSNPGFFRHEPKSEFHGALGLVAGSCEFQDTGSEAGRGFTADENFPSFDDVACEAEVRGGLGKGAAERRAALGESGIAPIRREGDR